MLWLGPANISSVAICWVSRPLLRKSQRNPAPSLIGLIRQPLLLLVAELMIAPLALLLGIILRPLFLLSRLLFLLLCQLLLPLLPPLASLLPRRRFQVPSPLASSPLVFGGSCLASFGPPGELLCGLLSSNISRRQKLSAQVLLPSFWPFPVPCFPRDLEGGVAA